MSATFAQRTCLTLLSFGLLPTLAFAAELETKLERLGSSQELLRTPDGVSGDFVVAKTPPQISFAYFPNQWEGARLWSNWGDSCLAADGNFYASIGDHAAPYGTAYVYRIDPKSGSVKLVVDFNEAAGLKDENRYAPGKIHGGLAEGRDGWIYFFGYRGVRQTTAEARYQGDPLLRYQVTTGKTENLGIPVLDHSVPVLLYNGTTNSLYGFGTPGATQDTKQEKFFRLSLDNNQVAYDGGPDPNMARALILADDGRSWYTVLDEATGKNTLVRYSPEKNEIKKLKVQIPGEGVCRAASRPAQDGTVYCISREGMLFTFNTKSEQIYELKPCFSTGKLYTATCRLDSTGRYLYYLPGLHGRSNLAGTPVLQYDTKTRQIKVLAFLNDFLRDKKNYNLGGTYGIELSQDGSQLCVNFNGNRLGEKQSEFGLCSVMVIEIPESERSGE